MQSNEIWTAEAARALQSAFGVSEPDGIEPLSGGLSGAAVLKIRVGGAFYVMRLQGTDADGAANAPWQRAMAIAAEAGVAPRVHFLDDGGTSIVDFVEPRAGAEFWHRDRAKVVADIGRLLARLHKAPAFPKTVDFVDAAHGLANGVKAAGLAPQADMERWLESFAPLAAAYRSLTPQQVSSHNDVNPRNIVHDGEHLWLVDWTAASVCDRYLDLASIGNFLARDPAHEAALLQGYFGAPATDAQRARLFLARQINHLCVAMTLFPTTGGARPAACRTLDAVHLALASGEPVFDTAEGRAEYALARCEEMVRNVQSDHFQEACGLAS